MLYSLGGLVFQFDPLLYGCSLQQPLLCFPLVFLVHFFEHNDQLKNLKIYKLSEKRVIKLFNRKKKGDAAAADMHIADYKYKSTTKTLDGIFIKICGKKIDVKSVLSISSMRNYRFNS